MGDAHVCRPLRVSCRPNFPSLSYPAPPRGILFSFECVCSTIAAPRGVALLSWFALLDPRIWSHEGMVWYFVACNWRIEVFIFPRFVMHSPEAAARVTRGASVVGSPRLRLHELPLSPAVSFLSSTWSFCIPIPNSPIPISSVIDPAPRPLWQVSGEPPVLVSSMLLAVPLVSTSSLTGSPMGSLDKGTALQPNLFIVTRCLLLGQSQKTGLITNYSWAWTLGHVFGEREDKKLIYAVSTK